MRDMSIEFFEERSSTYEQISTVEAVQLTMDNIMEIAAETEGIIEFDPDGHPRLTFNTDYGTRVVMPLGSLVTKNGKEVGRWSGRLSEWMKAQG